MDRSNHVDYRRRMKNIKVQILSCLLVLSGCLALPVPVPGETLDRLFFTPQERAYLEKLRWGPPESPLDTVTEPKPQIFTLQGTVTKKGAVQAVWLNAIKYNRATLPENVELKPPFSAGQILIHAPETGKTYALRPGQTIDINDGRTRESYQKTPAGLPTKAKPGPEQSPKVEPSSAPVQVLETTLPPKD
jgi:hypothetical protein